MSLLISFGSKMTEVAVNGHAELLAEKSVSLDINEIRDQGSNGSAPASQIVVPVPAPASVAVEAPAANGTESVLAQKKPFFYNDPENEFVSLVDRFIDEPRRLRVAVVGGGLSGVLAGILLPVKVPGIQLTIYEKNADFVRIIYGIYIIMSHTIPQ